MAIFLRPGAVINMFPGPDIYWQILPLFVFPLTKCRVTVRIE